MKYLYFTLVFLTGVFFCSCEEDEPAGISATGPLVIEGHIDSEGYTEVVFTSSIVPEGNSGTLDNSMIRWGKVTVSDGIKTIVLTGGPQSDYMPPYLYYGYGLYGTPGRTYTLEAEYDGKKVNAQCTMPTPTPIDRLECVSSGTAGLYSVMIHFTAPDDCPAYYHISTMLIGEEGHYYPSVLGTVCAETPGTHIEMPAYRGKHFGNSQSFTPLWHEGDMVGVCLARVSKEVYEFWTAYNNEVLFGGSQFVGVSESLPGNIVNGYGVWSARGVSHSAIEINRSQSL